MLALGSFSQILAPGLRLGWVQAEPALVQRMVLSGLLDSGGGLNPFTSGLVRSVLELVSAYERGEWEAVTKLLDSLKIELRAVAQVFVDSVDWARHATRAQSDGPWSSLPPPSVAK